MIENLKINIEEAIEKNVDRSKWEKWKFSDLVENIVEKVVPKDSGLEHYIGLEHLDTGSLKIRRFGETSSLIGDKQKIYKGDLIFAKRNAYLKRVAIAEIDAVASAHSMVLRPKSENVLPEFLPFFLLSETFWERAIEISVGSLSPTINWKVLAKQEFLLPPKDQQAKLAELLWAMDEVIEREIKLLEKLEKAYLTIVDNLFSKRNENWEFVTLAEIANINKNSLNSKTDPEYEFEYLDLASIIEPKVIGKLTRIKYREAPSRAKRIVNDDSIVLAMVRPYQKAFAYIGKGENIIASTGTAIINLIDKQLSKFVFHQFFSKRFTRYCENRMTGTNYPAITPSDVEEFKVSVPKDKDLITNECKKLDQLEVSSLYIKSKIDSSKSLQKSLIHEIF
ncbi:MAG: restriction endonuclease subunit S [Thiohalospira sp.]